MQKEKEKSEEKYYILQSLISFKHKTSIYYNKVGPYSALSSRWVNPQRTRKCSAALEKYWMLSLQSQGVAGREAGEFAARETDLAFTFA